MVSEEKGKSDKGLGGKELEINMGCHQVYPWTSPPPCLVVEPGEMSKAPVSVRDRLRLTREEKLW